MRVSKTTKPPRVDDIPEGGLCLSAFVVLFKQKDPNQVILGRLNPKAPWEHLGALDAERAERGSRGWMIPSSHLILHESPDAAARRILREQLGIPTQKLRGPAVFSEVYGEPPHWDVEFVFEGERSEIEPVDCWTRLEFVDVTRLRKSDISRWHEDILAHIRRYVSNYGEDTSSERPKGHYESARG